MMQCEVYLSIDYMDVFYDDIKHRKLVVGKRKKDNGNKHITTMAKVLGDSLPKEKYMFTCHVIGDFTVVSVFEAKIPREGLSFKMNKSLITHGIAKRNTLDEFSIETGIDVAFARALRNLAKRVADDGYTPVIDLVSAVTLEKVKAA